MIKSRSSTNPLSASWLYTFPRFFQLLIWTSQGKFVETTGKSVLKIIKLPSWKTLKIYSSLKSQNLTDACTVGAQTCPPRDTTNVFKFSQLSGAISLLNQDVSRGNDGFSLTGLCKKLKNRGRVRGVSRGRVQRVCTPPPKMTCGFLIQLVFCKKNCGLLVLK